MSKQKEYCFIINEFESKAEKDPELALNLEREALSLGAFPAKVDTPKELYCIYVDERPKDEAQFVKNVLNMLKKHGCSGSLIKPQL